MANVTLTQETVGALKSFLNQSKDAELVGTYLYYLEKQFHVEPTLYAGTKKIYRSADDVVEELAKEGKLWHETEIVIRLGEDEAVNDQTKKIYICPFTGKVFGDNTHPNPQDAIYDWVSRCPENKERVRGLRVKRFYVSEDPEVIKNYLKKSTVPELVRKVVYSSALTGKLFNTKEAVIQDFKNNQLKKMTLVEVQGQNRYQIDDRLLAFIQEHLSEDKITSFVEVLAEYPDFAPFVQQWVEE